MFVVCCNTPPGDLILVAGLFPSLLMDIYHIIMMAGLLPRPAQVGDQSQPLLLLRREGAMDMIGAESDVRTSKHSVYPDVPHSTTLASSPEEVGISVQYLRGHL